MGAATGGGFTKTGGGTTCGLGCFAVRAEMRKKVAIPTAMATDPTDVHVEKRRTETAPPVKVFILLLCEPAERVVKILFATSATRLTPRDGPIYSPARAAVDAEIP